MLDFTDSAERPPIRYAYGRHNPNRHSHTEAPDTTSKYAVHWHTEKWGAAEPRQIKHQP